MSVGQILILGSSISLTWDTEEASVINFEEVSQRFNCLMCSLTLMIMHWIKIFERTSNIFNCYVIIKQSI